MYIELAVCAPSAKHQLSAMLTSCRSCDHKLWTKLQFNRSSAIMVAAWLLPLAIVVVLRLLLLKLRPNSTTPLPPGPSTVAFFAKHIVFRRKWLFELRRIFLNLHDSYGPVVCLRTLPNPTVFIQDHCVAHQALVQLDATIADRPPLKEPALYLSCNGRNINSSCHGPLWRLLRRNLVSEILHPTRFKLFASARQWALRALFKQISTNSEDGNGAVLLIRDKLKTAVFCLLAAMCFGQTLGPKQIEELMCVQRSILLIYNRPNPFAVLPKITKVIFSEKWNQIVGLRRRQAEMFAPLIMARRDQLKLHGSNKGGCYVDSLLEIHITEERGRKLEEDEIMNLCHEFLFAGTDTTSNSLEWIMAELVKHQDIQRRLLEEIEGVTPAGEEIEEDDLEKMPYLKAVITEGLRRHPPAPFVLPHRAAEDVKLHGLLIPKGSEVHINVAQLGADERVWREPTEFRPERFLAGGEGEGVDITGSREIKMMPCGAERRICPAIGLAMLHLECFVANLVREFEWKVEKGEEEVDLTEDFETNTIMKNPLRAQIIPTKKKKKKNLI